MRTISLESRRAVMSLKTVEQATLISPQSEHKELKHQIETFARGKSIGVSFVSHPDRLVINRSGFLASTLKYGEVDTLEVGESHLFKLPVSEHPLIRSAMTYRAKRTGRVYRCVAEDGALRVTRMPVTDEEKSQFSAPVQVPRQTKYGLDQLAATPELRLGVPRVEHEKVRMAAFRIALRNGWQVSCKAQKDGSIVVFRPDKLQPGASPIAEKQPARPTNRFDLDRLESTPSLIFNIKIEERAALRLACHRYAARKGVTIRCRQQDDGTMLVTLVRDSSHQ